MSDKTVQSGRLIFIDPNDLPAQGYNINPSTSSDNIPWKQEDLTYSVDLLVSIPSITDCGQHEYEPFIVHLQNEGSSPVGRFVSFMQGDMVHDNTSFLTTNFIDASYQEIMNNEVSSKENLGITSVNVDFDAHFFPQVTINFVDVRGYSLFMPEEVDYRSDLAQTYLNNKTTEGADVANKYVRNGYANFFKSLFHFPYPKFYLSIKGYYGSRVTFSLSVSDFRSSFNSNTGNFEVSVKFIGYMYGVYADIPMQCLFVAPYIGGNDENGTNSYWNSKIDNDFAFADGEPMITFIEYMKKYAEVGDTIDTNILLGDENSSKQLDLSKENTALSNLLKLYNEAIDTIGKGSNLAIISGVTCCAYFSNSSITIDTKKLNAFLNCLSEVNSTYNLNIKDINNFQENTSSLSLQKIFSDDGENLDTESEAYKFLAKKDSSILTKLNEVKGNKNIKGLKVFILEKGEIESKVKEQIEKNNALFSELCTTEESYETIKEVVSKSLGFTPTLENAFRMIFAHLDCFTHLFYGTLNEIYKKGEARSLKNLNIDREKNTEDNRASKDTPLYPFPGLFITENGERKSVFPTEIKGSNINSDNMPEIKLVNEFRSAIDVSGEKIKAVKDYLRELDNRKKEEEEEGETSTDDNDNDIFGNLNNKSLFFPPEIDHNENEWTKLKDDLKPGTIFDVFYHGHNPYEYLNISDNEQHPFADGGDALIHFFLSRLFLYRNYTCAINYGSNSSTYSTNYGQVNGTTRYYCHISNDKLHSFVDNEAKLFLSVYKGNKSKYLIDGIRSLKEGINVDERLNKIGKGGFVNLIPIWNKKTYSGCAATTNNDSTNACITKILEQNVRIIGEENVTDFYDRIGQASWFSRTNENTTSGNAGAQVSSRNTTTVGCVSCKQDFHSNDYGRVYLQKNMNEETYDFILSGTKHVDKTETYLNEEKLESYNRILDIINNDNERLCFPLLQWGGDNEPSNMFHASYSNGSLVDIYTKNTVSKTLNGVVYSAEDLTYFARMLLFYASMSLHYSINTYVDYLIDDTRCSKLPYCLERYLFYSTLRKKIYDNCGGYDILNTSKIFEKCTNAAKEYKSETGKGEKLTRPTDYLITHDGVFFGKSIKNVVKVSSFMDILYNDEDFKQITSSMEYKEFRTFYEELTNTTNAKKVKFSYVAVDNKGKTEIKECTNEVSVFNKEVQKKLIELYKKTVLIINFKKVKRKPALSTYEPSENIDDIRYGSKTFVDRFIKAIAPSFNGDTTPEDETVEETNEHETVYATDDVKVTMHTMDQKRALYFTFKSLYERWFASMKEDRFHLMGKSECDNITKKRFVAGELGTDISKEYNNFLFIDSYYNWIGDKMLINPEILYNLIDDYQKNNKFSVYEFMADLAQQNKLLFLALPVYNNFYNTDTISNIFKPHHLYSPNSKQDMGIGNTYVCMYTHEASKYLDNLSNNGICNDGIDISDTIGVKEVCDEIFKADEINGMNFNVPAFNVAYGAQNQNYFKTITVNMDNPAVTDYSISNLLQIAQGGSNGAAIAPLGTGQNLYSIYSNRSYNCTVTMMGCMNLMPSMYFQLNNIPMFKGAYMIVSVKHDVTPGGMTTTFTGIRVSKNRIPFNKNIFNVQAIIERALENGDRIPKYAPPSYPIEGKWAKVQEITGQAPRYKVLLDANGKVLNPTEIDSESYLSDMMVPITVKAHGANQKDVRYNITVHKALASTVQNIFDDIYNVTIGGKYFEVHGISHTRYTFVPIKGKGRQDKENPNLYHKTLSMHDYGVAIDINASQNPQIYDEQKWKAHIANHPDDYTHITTNRHPVVQIFYKYKWYWGGDWNSQKDFMHFSATGG